MLSSKSCTHKPNVVDQALFSTTSSIKPKFFASVGVIKLSLSNAFVISSLFVWEDKNGFIIFDSDFYDNAGNAGAFGTGIYPSPHDGVLMTDEIDMSGYTDITLRFHSYFRTFAGQAFVDFYINGVFDSRVQVHSNLGANDATTTDAIALTRVPFSVVGNTNVKMTIVNFVIFFK